MITFIRICFFMMVQHGMSAGGNGSGVNFSAYAPVPPATYDQLVFTIRGEDTQVGIACMSQPFFAGVTGTQEQEPGVFKVTVSFRKLPAAKVSDIVARLTPNTEIINLESR